LTKAPSSLLDALEQHLNALEGKKGSAANTPTQTARYLIGNTISLSKCSINKLKSNIRKILIFITFFKTDKIATKNLNFYTKVLSFKKMHSKCLTPEETLISFDTQYTKYKLVFSNC
jgi:hypothetical protein